MALPALTDAELAFLRELDARGVHFVVIGMGAAVLQGATAVTQDLDLWCALPSSQASPVCTMPSPHRASMHAFVHASVSIMFPSSHASTPVCV